MFSFNAGNFEKFPKFLKASTPGPICMLLLDPIWGPEAGPWTPHRLAWRYARHFSVGFFFPLVDKYGTPTPPPSECPGKAPEKVGNVTILPKR